MGIDDMELFAKLVELRSLSGAARVLGISKSGASRRLGDLEKRLGAQLLYRTSRAVRPTEAGLVYYEGCKRVLGEVVRAESEVSHLRDAPVGRLRIHGPQLLGAQWLAPALTAFLARHPGLGADLFLHDDFVDLIQEDVDLAIRVGPLPDSSLVVRRFGRVDRVIAASPAYLARRGTPAAWSELASHDWLLYSQRPAGDEELRASRDGRSLTVRVGGPLRSNSGAVILEALLAGIGLTAPPLFLVADALARGTLVQVLADHALAPMWLAAVYPHTRDVAAKVRWFVDFLQHEYPPPPGLGPFGG